MVRPVRDILGENVSPLRIIEPPKANGGRTTDGSVRTQGTASSSSLASSNGNPAQLRRENSGILIDFDAVPGPSLTTAVPQTQQAALVQSVGQPTTSSNADNWACFDSPAEVKVSQAPAPATANAHSLESVLSQLSVPSSVPGHIAGIHSGGGLQTTTPLGNMSVLPSISNSLVVPLGNMSASPFGSGAPAAASVNNFTTFPPGSAPAAAPVGHMSVSPFGGGAPAAVPVNNLTTFSTGGAPAALPGSVSVLPVNGSNSFAKFADEGRWPAMHPQQLSLFPDTASQPTAQPFTPPVGGSSIQPWNTSLAPNTLGPSSIPAAQASQAFSKPSLEVTSGVVTQPSPVEVKPSGRKELPLDLFTATHSLASVPVPGWQTGLPYGFGYAMQYNTAMPIPNFPQSSKSANPFDLGNEMSPIQASTFPSMASLQGALPNMAAPSGLMHTSRLNTPSPAWMQPQSYPSTIPPQASYYASATPPSAYMGEQLPTNLPSRQQQVVGFGNERASFGPANSYQQLGRTYSASANPNTFTSVGGNPFG
ncbi:hypothetical protein F0562_030006 [Nyssa sinensis]|uniref:ADP-ribosylation factor GTPase-activating protein AGD14 n=1 Tax=Nyssa sinensis TaxID=561372 RepID=A0A5J5AVS0_9ASTE|nr:hypothetical protein F0562_030006 [Nyssa sinensis]